MSIQMDNLPRLDPTTGEAIDPLNADQLVDGLERIKERMKRLGAVKAQFEEAIALLAKCDARTERVAGERRQVKLEWPGKQFNRPGLKALWYAAPTFREQYLRIESVGVQLVEYDKLLRTSGTEELEKFKSSIIQLEQPNVGKPTITIER